ncbi:hypothetical protein V8E54_003524 [Elaphomyces granulatus]
MVNASYSDRCAYMNCLPGWLNEDTHSQHSWNLEPWGRGAYIARTYGLDNSIPIMYTSWKAGAGQDLGLIWCMFKSNDKYYIWDELVDEVEEITTSTDIHEIVDIIRDFGKLGMKAVER